MNRPVPALDTNPQSAPSDGGQVRRRIVVGVDGGGTHTRVALVDEDGRILGLGRAGPGCLHDVGAEGVRDAIAAALAAASEQTARAPERAAAAFLGLGSLVADADRAAVHRVATDLGLAPPDRIGVDHDLRVALAGAHAGRPGIVLIAGTGSSCFGRDIHGRTWRAGGWGSTLDDLGSSKELGRQALVAAIRAADGRGAPTVLEERAIAALGLDDISALPRRADSPGLGRSELAALAHLVTEAARDGDPVARRILEDGADELAQMAEAVLARLDFAPMSPVPLAVTGGLTSTGEVVLEPLRRALQRRAPRCEIVAAALPPVLGAAWLALELLDGTAPGAAAVERLTAGTTEAAR